MKHLKQKLDLVLYGYDCREFLPIRYDGQLVNRSAYLTYRVKRLIRTKSLI